MKVTAADGMLYKVAWEHFRACEATSFLNLLKKEEPKSLPVLRFREFKRTEDLITDVTRCAITNLDNASVFIVGLAFCSVKDTFSKETGRKVSLTKALESFSKEFRTLVWRAYFNRKKN